MKTRITDDLWIDLERIVRVSREGHEVKYTMDYKDKMVTYYCPDEITGIALLRALETREQERRMIAALPTRAELIAGFVNNGEEA